MAESDALAIRQLVVLGDLAAAEQALAAPLEALAERSLTGVRITSDAYSLNSVSGVAEFSQGEPVFFKFHVEEDEAGHVGEYYRASVLHEAGLPIDLPLAVSTRPGGQLVLYRVRHDTRMVDECRQIERDCGDAANLPEDLAVARRALDRAVGDVGVRTLRVRHDEGATSPAVHQLFSQRMHDPEGHYPGGRLARWYMSDSQWADLEHRAWTVDGVDYKETLAALVARARCDLAPAVLDRGPVVTAHGDDHLGNVWVERARGRTRLVLFDPAFAGDDLPALLAFAKPTFHNVFAHPAWLYHPGEVDLARVTVEVTPGAVRVDAPPLSPMRLAMLDSLVDEAWIPLLTAMAAQGILPPTWRQTVRSALLLCPLLVTNLISESRVPVVRLLGLANAVRMGSEPASGSDALTRALDRMQEAIDPR